MAIEFEEISFKVALDGKEVQGRLWRQVGGNWQVYVNNYVYGAINKYDGGWMVILNRDDYNQGDADELLQIAGISLDEKYPIKGYLERKAALPDKYWYKKKSPFKGA